MAPNLATALNSDGKVPLIEDPPSLDTEDLDVLQAVVPTLVEAVMAEAEESLREDDKLESDDGLRVTVHEFRRRPTMRIGNPQPMALTESERDELKLSLDTDSARRCLRCCFCWISAIW